MALSQHLYLFPSPAMPPEEGKGGRRKSGGSGIRLSCERDPQYLGDGQFSLVGREGWFDRIPLAA